MTRTPGDVMRGAGRGDEPRRVLVRLHGDGPNEACLDRLRGLGLVVEEIVGGTVIGTAAASARRRLAADPQVAAVEVSRQLRPHEDPGPG